MSVSFSPPTHVTHFLAPKTGVREKRERSERDTKGAVHLFRVRSGIRFHSITIYRRVHLTLLLSCYERLMVVAPKTAPNEPHVRKQVTQHSLFVHVIDSRVKAKPENKSHNQNRNKSNIHIYSYIHSYIHLYTCTVYLRI